MTFVTLLVNVLRFPITLPEKLWTPPTTEAAMSAPGRAEVPCGNEADGRAPPPTAAVDAGCQVGS